ncbi:hypothetical protein DBB29_19540 [Pandoraea cepalis]|uniref:Peptidase C39-like domain-containing protein n=1 Tax=Pandoraea cepalis TaxID=2508294 RepID=A0AAW7MPU7_9BURK|nr:hypothetical protein [Pandoraea cepalis]MDN4574799.1 hypothetical protein [Pandoraea cepalis]MDN4580302.1 hypothetical protein [Pandoraea cepalis]
MELTVQKIHPALRSGRRLLIAGSKSPTFSFQGSLDSSCALHATAMGLALHRRMQNPLRPTSRYTCGERDFIRRVLPFWHTGISMADLHALMWELNLELKPELFEGAHADVVRFCELEARQGRPVVMAFRERQRTCRHAVLVVGVEGRQTGRTFQGHTLLAIDSSEGEPSLAAYNARLTWSGSDQASARHAVYETTFDRKRVVVTEAISLRSVPERRRRTDKPP